MTQKMGKCGIYSHVGGPPPSPPNMIIFAQFALFFGHFVAVLLNWIGSKKNIVNIVDTVDIVEAIWNNLGSN